jgi:hypothetical protein
LVKILLSIGGCELPRSLINTCKGLLDHPFLHWEWAYVTPIAQLLSLPINPHILSLLQSVEDAIPNGKTLPRIV